MRWMSCCVYPLFLVILQGVYIIKLNMFRRVLILIMILIPLGVAAQSENFPLPLVPDTLKGPRARANYLALHYWDRYDFADNGLIGSKDISEQGFSNFISIMPYVTEKEAAFGQLAKRMVANCRMLDYFVALGLKYLYEPLSPVYDEALYILMLEKVLEQPALTEEDRQEYAFDLKMASKNRPGDKAADFGFLMRDGNRSSLSKVKGDYILLFLGDPECDICIDVKEQLLASPSFMRNVENGRLKVLSVCVEGNSDAWRESPAPKQWIDACDEKQQILGDLLYDIPGLPLLYLLDSEHRVLLKNVPPSYIEGFFSR